MGDHHRPLGVPGGQMRELVGGGGLERAARLGEAGVYVVGDVWHCERPDPHGAGLLEQGPSTVAEQGVHHARVAAGEKIQDTAPVWCWMWLRSTPSRSGCAASISCSSS